MTRDPIKLAARAEKARIRARAWAAAHPELNRAKAAAWAKANKRAAQGRHTASDITTIFKHQRGLCAICREIIADGYEVDHVMPLALGGSNGKENLQLLCRPCNRRKGSKHPVAFMRERGFLL